MRGKTCLRRVGFLVGPEFQLPMKLLVGLPVGHPVVISVELDKNSNANANAAVASTTCLQKDCSHGGSW